MVGHLKKIDFIKNLAVFQDFNWASSVRDGGNNVAEFKKINILYGRNYSGKTTLSRILRALETSELSDKFENPEFQLLFDGGVTVTPSSIGSHGKIIRVFNEDFVKDNLKFIVDDEQTINSFAILGEDNARIEQEIESHEEKLGNEEEKTGLIGKHLDADKNFSAAQRAHNNRSTQLEEKLRDKANKAGSGIKHNKLFGDANYNVTKIKTDIAAVSKDSYTPLIDEETEKFHELLKEEPKDEIQKLSSFDLEYSTIASKAKELVEKKIQASNPIQELLNDSLLATWVRSGREHHENKRSKCAFCGNDLPLDLWKKLDEHFNRESEELRSSIGRLLESVESEISRAPKLLTIKRSEFYSSFSNDLDNLAGDFETHSIAYCEGLKSIKKQLVKRQNDIFTPCIYESPVSVEKDLFSIQDRYEELRNKSNTLTTSLGADQTKARTALRLHEVYTFILDIKYADEQKAIIALKKEMEKASTAKNIAKDDVEEKRKTINELKAQLKDESKGADRVNDYLNNFFGHQSLFLKAIEESLDGEVSRYRFEVTRNNKKAYHLSEGECSLIAFCYFMAKLEDVETKGSQPIIWIDDPISSLDANHVFFVYSLINAKIATVEQYEDNGEIKERERFRQLFISTHNLDFLKYLKRLPGALNKRSSQYFIVNRVDKSSEVFLMPRYLKEYVTEFNYLFNHIYQCASIEQVDDSNYTTFYNFGNNARKFFEIYLYYKYPNKGMCEETLSLFFGAERIPAVLTDRINNEYSHLAGVFERGSTPVEVPEMKKSASLILDSIRTKDPDQFSALLESIGAQNA